MIRVTAVIAFTEFILRVDIGHRIAETGKKTPVVAYDITVMESDDPALSSCQNIADGNPDSSSFSSSSRMKIIFFQKLIKLFHPGAIIPDDFKVLMVSKSFFDFLKLFLVRCIQA